jgi:hypothetical protein
VSHFVASLVRFRYGLPRLLAPLHGSDWDAPALGDFYFQAFDRSVSLPVAGYNYNSDLDSSVGGTLTRWNGS